MSGIHSIKRCCKIKEFYQAMVGLEYIMANPDISDAEMLRRLDRAIKNSKKEFSGYLFGDIKCQN